MPYRILLLLFCIITISAPNLQATDPVRIRKVVIDAGHGGYDPGAISPNRKVKEKDITLSVALKLGRLIEENHPDIKVIYTRSTDVFIPLNTRTEIANKNQADLFISIHVNSAKARSASGSETFVMGESKSSSNLEVTMMENSVIALEGDHQSVYEGFDPKNPESYIIFSLLQNAHLEQSLLIAEYVQDQFSKGPVKVNRGIKQGGLLVLWKSSMPAILVELGFISNPNDYTVLLGDENHEKYAKSLYRAFDKYRRNYESEKVATIRDTQFVDRRTQDVRARKAGDTTLDNVEVGTPPHRDAQKDIRRALQKVKDTSTSTPVISDEMKMCVYRIQILAVTKILPDNAPDFKGEKKLKYIKVGNFYKYSIGEFNSKEDALRELSRIKTKFPQAFIIKVEDEKEI